MFRVHSFALYFVNENQSKFCCQSSALVFSDLIKSILSNARPRIIKLFNLFPYEQLLRVKSIWKCFVQNIQHIYKKIPITMPKYFSEQYSNTLFVIVCRQISFVSTLNSFAVASSRKMWKSLHSVVQSVFKQN